MKIVMRIVYTTVVFFWVVIPAGMGLPPFHRFHRIFKLEPHDNRD